MSQLVNHFKYAVTTATDILQHEGLIPFIKKGFLYYLPPVLMLPWFIPQANRVKQSKSLASKINFAYDRFLGVIKPGQVKSEITKLAAVVNSLHPQTIVEIGTCKGGTLFIWSCLLSHDGVIASVDLPYGQFGGGYHFWKIPFYKSFARGSQKIHLIRGNSHKTPTLEKLKKILNGRPVDFLFIDGDHSEKGVTADFKMYSQLVRKGGIIALHDIVPSPSNSNCHVDYFWQKIKNKYPTKDIIEHKNQVWGGIGVVYL